MSGRYSEDPSIRYLVTLFLTENCPPVNVTVSASSMEQGSLDYKLYVDIIGYMAHLRGKIVEFKARSRFSILEQYLSCTSQSVTSNQHDAPG